MAINVTSTSASPIINGTFDDGRTQHDVLDLVNGKAYRHLQITGGAAVAVGDAIAGSSGASHNNNLVIGIAVSAIANNNYGFIQSFGFGSAKVAAGTPANAFLVPSATTGVLREIDLSNPDLAMNYLALLDQRIHIQALPDPTPFFRPIRGIVSLTAESGGMADVFIF